MNALEAINLSKTYSATDGFFLKTKKISEQLTISVLL